MNWNNAFSASVAVRSIVSTFVVAVDTVVTVVTADDVFVDIYVPSSFTIGRSDDRIIISGRKSYIDINAFCPGIIPGV
jgi:hypothetical protein